MLNIRYCIDVVKSLDDKWNISLKHKKPKSKPVVAHHFNETVAMDIKQIRNVYILHLINHKK